MTKYHLAPVCALIITSLFLASCPSQDAPDDGGEAATHTITFVKNDAGATGTMESQTVTEGASAVLASNAFAKGSWDSGAGRLRPTEKRPMPTGHHSPWGTPT